MFLINRGTNRIQALKERTFNELGFRERDHLQEWLAKEPNALGEELLIIQKEFDGFNNTNERLDLLALDKMGNLVIVENKLDDSGRDVTWQVLKYASYCSSLTKEQVRSIYQSYLDKYSDNEKAEDNICEFYNGQDYEDIAINKGMTQRIIMVARSFRREVTSSVLWLLNYKLQIQCFKVTPYSLDDDTLFLTFEQIIPVRDAEEYVINMAEKNQIDVSSQQDMSNRHSLRLGFWKELLEEMNKRCDLFKNINPSKDNWIGCGSGIASTAFNFVISRNYARVELMISRSVTEENKYIFDRLQQRSEQIEGVFGQSLVWERLDNKKSCRIKFQDDSFNAYEKETWADITEFLVVTMIRFHKALVGPVQDVRQELIGWLDNAGLEDKTNGTDWVVNDGTE